MNASFPDGVMFCTYSCLISGKKRRGGGTLSRFEQLADWFCQGNPTYGGVVVFDECHKAKNVNIKNPTAASKTARNVIGIQARLKGAGVVYVSATGASELDHLGYMSRLGLWGRGTSFVDNKDFSRSVGSKGVGAMELVAMDLKARGLFLARSLSYVLASFFFGSGWVDAGFPVCWFETNSRDILHCCAADVTRA